MSDPAQRQDAAWTAADEAHRLLVGAHERAGLARDIASELNGSLHVRRIVLRLFDLIRPRFADWAMLVRPGNRPGEVTVYGGEDPQFTAEVALAPGRHSVLERVMASGQTEVAHVSLDYQPTGGLDCVIPHTGLLEEAAALRPADVLALGLTARGTFVGVLVLVRGADGGFPADDLALAEEIAGRVAMALDSARLYEERAHVVSVLQKSLRPPRLPRIPGVGLSTFFRPAAEHLEVSGDFYDVHGSGVDWLVVLGDVCGKGAEAAMLTGLTRQSIRTAAYFDRRPASVLAALNAVLYEEQSDRFVTVVCARVRPGSEEGSVRVDLAVAGHPAPMIVRGDGTVEEVDVSGRLSGVFPDLDYEDVAVEIGADDTMVMFSDGIYEARGEEGVYGLDRLQRLVASFAGAGPEALAQAVEQDVVEYLSGHPHDDMTLLALAGRR